MLHLLLYALLAIVVAAVLFAVAARFLPAGEQIAPALRDEPLWELPADRSLHPEDVDAVRLPVALRGYRFAETDILLDRLARELRARDEQIAQLRARTPDPDAPRPAAQATAAEPLILEPPAVEPPAVEPLILEPPAVEPDPHRGEPAGGDDTR